MAADGAREPEREPLRELASELAREAAVEALCAHPQAVGVQEHGCRVLANVCCSIDAAAGAARRQRAAGAEALEAAVRAIRAHPQAVAVLEEGCAVLASLCCGDDDVGAWLAKRARGAEVKKLEKSSRARD